MTSRSELREDRLGGSDGGRRCVRCGAPGPWSAVDEDGLPTHGYCDACLWERDPYTGFPCADPDRPAGEPPEEVA